MNEHLTLADVKRVVTHLKKYAIKPEYVRSQDQADALNRLERELGLPAKWKVGDEFITVHLCAS